MTQQDIDPDWNAHFKFDFGSDVQVNSLTANVTSKDGAITVGGITTIKCDSLELLRLSGSPFSSLSHLIREADGQWSVKFNVPEMDGLKIRLQADGRDGTPPPPLTSFFRSLPLSREHL